MNNYDNNLQIKHHKRAGVINYLSILVFLLFLCLLFNSTVFAESLSGKQVMEKQKELQKADTEYGEEMMLLVDVKSGSKKKRLVKRYAKDKGNGLNRYLLVFMDPADIKGTALLTHENETQDDQWLYMPATKKMQRIAQGSKKSYFMGTDFTYEDMTPEEIDNFKYKILRKEAVDHVKPPKECYVIESVPATKKQKRASGYTKRLLWVDSENFLTLKAEFYGRRDKLIKTQKSYEIQHIKDTIFRPKKTIMDNHKKKHKTLTMVKKRALNKKIDNSTFTERYILSGRHIE